MAGLLRGGKQVIDRDKDEQQDHANTEAPADQFFLNRQQRLGGLPVQFVVKFGCDMVRSFSSPVGFHAGEEQPRDQEANPDHETEQGDEIDRASLPMPSAHRRLKFDSTPIEKNVRMKKITRNVFASPIAAGTLDAIAAGVARAR